jgi:hypothetical protein
MGQPMHVPDQGIPSADIRVSTRSLLSDRVWHLDGLRPGGNRSDFSLDWCFRMHDDSRFGDPQWADWASAAKRFLWSLKVDPPPGRKGVHDGTLVSAFNVLRTLIRWMAERGCRCFADLHRDDAVEFIDVVAQRPGKTAGKTLSAATVSSYLGMLHLLYLQGSRLPEVAIDEPIAALIKRSKNKDGGWLPYTPDEIALPLVSAALRLIGTPADDVIALWHQAQATYDEALAAGIGQTKAGFVVVDAIAGFSFSTLPGEDEPWHPSPVVSTKQVRARVAHRRSLLHRRRLPDRGTRF